MTISRMTMMAAVLGCAAAALAQSGQPKQQLTVYVENKAEVSGQVLLHARWMATQMFARIGVGLEWRPGTHSGSKPEGVILMRLVVNTPQAYRPGALAYSFVFEGVHTTLFYDRIREGVEGEPSTILAHVMVHEITHLVQGVDHHSDSGVMKALWTQKDFVEMRFKPLSFTLEDVYLIENGLRARASRQMALVAAR